MILSKLFTGWDIASSKISKRTNISEVKLVKLSHDFSHHLRKKTLLPNLALGLLLPYTIAMLAVMGVSAIAVYQFFAHTLYEELDQQLANLASAATHSLPNVLSGRISGKDVTQTKTPKTFDNDGDLDIPWQDLRRHHQSVEWFDPKGKRLVSTGDHIPQSPLSKKLQTRQENKIRALTVPVYATELEPRKKSHTIDGYVRVSMATIELEDDLSRLLMGLQIGGGISLILIAGTGWWLTSRSLKPIKKSVRQLQQFTADASHELRSPLAAIRTAAEVMQSHPERIHPHDVTKLASIVSATHQIGQLVEDLLLLARMDSNAAELASTWISIPIDEILEDLLELLEPVAIAKNISLQARSKWSGDFLVKGDAAKLRRLLLNLIDNAIKYTPSGGKVRVSLVKTDSEIIVGIEDTGIGIAPQQIAKVFDRFWRADQARSHAEEGSGLGLAIAQAIAHMHQGEISVYSQLKIGSCFTLLLPSA